MSTTPQAIWNPSQEILDAGSYSSAALGSFEDSKAKSVSDAKLSLTGVLFSNLRRLD